MQYGIQWDYKLQALWESKADASSTGSSQSSPSADHASRPGGTGFDLSAGSNGFVSDASHETAAIETTGYQGTGTSRPISDEDENRRNEKEGEKGNDHRVRASVGRTQAEKEGKAKNEGDTSEVCTDAVETGSLLKQPGVHTEDAEICESSTRSERAARGEVTRVPSGQGNGADDGRSRQNESQADSQEKMLEAAGSFIRGLGGDDKTDEVSCLPFWFRHE